MARITRFKNVEGWKKARELSRETYAPSNAGAMARGFSLNIAEGFGRGGHKEFVQFFGHARGSAAEVEPHLYVACAAGMLPRVEFDRRYRLASEAGALISGLMKYLQGADLRGRKFKATVNSDL